MIIRIATPLPNDVNAISEQLLSIRRLTENKNYQWQHIEIHGPIIANNRNLLVNYENMNFDKILFVDGDISFDSEDFNLLMNSDLPVISGKYYLRDNTLSYWNFEERKKIYPESSLGYIKVENTGLGFCLIDKSVFERLKKARHKMFFYYRLSDYTDLYLGEDVGFCRACASVNIPIYIHNGVFVKHIIRNQP